jgi:hypothetical protein
MPLMCVAAAASFTKGPPRDITRSKLKEIKIVLTNVFAAKPLAILTTLFVVAAAAVVVLVASPTSAAAPLSNCKVNGQDGVKTAIGVGGETCIPIGGSTLETNPIMLYLFGALRIFSGLVALATVGGFLWGGVLYITARANAGQVEKAKLVMINSTSGLLLFIFMYAILNFLIPGGFFSG